MERSYLKKAYPWDNACIEAFHALIKREWLNRFKICNYRQAYQMNLNNYTKELRRMEYFKQVKIGSRRFTQIKYRYMFA